MPQLIQFDEFHLTLLVPDRLLEAEAATIKKVLDGKRFQQRLRRAVREVLRSYRTLRNVRVRLSR